MRRLGALALGLVLAHSAWAQNYGAPISGVFNGSGTNLSGSIGTISLNPNAVNSFANFSIGPYDFSQGPADARPNIFTTILSPTVSTGNVWENDNSFVELSGTGPVKAEINVNHSYFQIDAPATLTGQSEGYENSALNNGGLNVYYGNLAIFHNGSTGIVSNFIYGIGGSLTQDNPATGAISGYAFIGFGGITGTASNNIPSTYYLIRNTEPNAALVTEGVASIGGTTPAIPTNQLLTLTGLDSTSSKYTIFAKNLAAGNIFFVDDTGSVTAGTLTLGGPSVWSSNNWGQLCLGNTTSGANCIRPLSSGALFGTLTMPNNVTSTIATLAAQTFAGTQTLSGFTLTASPVTVGAGQLSIGATVFATTNCGSIAGAAGCISTNIGGTQHYVPYF